MTLSWRCAATVADIGPHRLHVQRDQKAEQPWFDARIDGKIVGGHATEAGAQAIAEKLARQMDRDVS